MAGIRAARTREGVLLTGSLPEDFSGELEVFPLKGGIFLVSRRGALGPFPQAGQQQPPPGQQANLSEAEKDLLRKLLAVRFEQRTPAKMAATLSGADKRTLEGLVAKKAVHVFRKGKYEKEGVYNVSDFAFNAVREPAPSPPQTATPLPPSSPEHLDSQGWMVLENEADARNFALRFPDKFKSGEVRGVRAFDMRYYFVTKGLLVQYGKQIQLALTKSEKSAEEIASEVSLAPGACLAMLINLCDSGEAMEKHRGKFTKA